MGRRDDLNPNQVNRRRRFDGANGAEDLDEPRFEEDEEFSEETPRARRRISAPRVDAKRASRSQNSTQSARTSTASAPAYFVSATPYGLEDPQVFWARSNARLGVDSNCDVQSKRNQGMVEYPCAICGVFVSLDRWPKHRHAVRCEACRQAMGELLSPEERSMLAADAKHANPNRFEGLPEMTPEDLEALAEMRAASNLGNGRSGNTPSERRSRRPGRNVPKRVDQNEEDEPYIENTDQQPLYADPEYADPALYADDVERSSYTDSDADELDDDSSES